MPSLASFCFVFIFSRRAVHTKTSILWGTKPFHIPFIASWWGTKLCLSSSREKNLVEKWPGQLKVQINLSSLLSARHTFYSICWSLDFSAKSCGRRNLFHEKVQTHLNRSQKLNESTEALGIIVIEKSLGKVVFKGEESTQGSCQNRQLAPLFTHFLTPITAKFFAVGCFKTTEQICFHGPPLGGMVRSNIVRVDGYL